MADVKAAKPTVDKWAKPQVVDALTRAFPGSVSHLMPSWDELQTAKISQHWIDFQQAWFFKGIKHAGLKAKPGIDKAVALGHLATIHGSYEPKHEHKEAAVAYLADRWLDDSSVW